MKIIFFLFVTLTNIFALNFTLVPYIASSTYEDVSKESSKIKGVYVKFYTPEYALEASYESNKIDYNSTIGSVSQDDITLAYSQIISNNYRVKGALHYIESDQNASDKAEIYLLGAQYFKKNSLDMGVDISFSKYDKSAIADSVEQIRPYAGISFGHYNSLMGRYVVKAGATIIYPSYTDSNSSLESSYTSYDISLTQYKGNFITKLTLWRGDQLYSVRDNAFSVYNLNELHSAGIYLSSRYAFSQDMGLRVSFNREDFRDLDVDKIDKMQRYLLSFDYTIR